MAVSKVMQGQLSFFFSVSNVIFSTWLSAVYPWNYWIWHTIKNILFMAWQYLNFKKRNWQWFQADFCYIVNHLSFLYFGLCYLKATFPKFAVLKEYLNPHGPMLFRIAFSWSTGVSAYINYIDWVMQLLSLYAYVSWLSYITSYRVVHWRANAGFLLSYNTILISTFTTQYNNYTITGTSWCCGLVH